MTTLEERDRSPYQQKTPTQIHKSGSQGRIITDNMPTEKYNSSYGLKQTSGGGDIVDRRAHAFLNEGAHVESKNYVDSEEGSPQQPARYAN